MSDRKPKPAPDTDSAAPKGERIAKRLARAGLCSRREAERWIEAGRVAVDGKTLDTPAFTVTAANRVVVDGKPLPAAEPAALWRYHKPGGLVTTNRDPQGRPTIFEKLPADLPRVMTVGRLDLTTEGLLLLTNDGALARHLELPSTGWSRRYRVRVHGKPDPNALKALGDGITISGIHYGPITARLDREQGSNAWLTFVIREGKNREIRRVCEHLGLTVNRLIRVGYGPFELGDLAPGAVARVPARILRDQLGKALPEVDFGGAEKPAAARPAFGGRPRPGPMGKPGPKGKSGPKGRPGPHRPDDAKPSPGGKRPFGDRPARAKAAETADGVPARPGRPVRGKGPEGKGPGAGRKPPEAGRSGGPTAKRDAEMARWDTKPPRKEGGGARSGPTKGKPPGRRGPQSDKATGPDRKTGPDTAPRADKTPQSGRTTKSDKTPRSDRTTGPPKAPAAPTGRSRGSTRRRRTLDANRRRPS